MESIEPLSEIKDKKRFYKLLKTGLYKIGGILELLVFLAIWVMIFNSDGNIGGFTRTEMITYIIFGNSIGLISGYFLHRVIVREAYQKKSGLLIYRPFRYFKNILLRGMLKSILPFFSVLAFHLAILYFFLDNFVFNYDLRYWLLIGLMIILAFITEFLMVYIVSLYAYWVIEAGDLQKIVIRIKKFLAGNYFPLSILPIGFLQVSLFLPFAYSFFVPTELFLKKITISEGWRGIFIQIAWIVILYIFIKSAWKRKRDQEIEAKEND